MVQFYFLAIFVNLIGGLYFANDIFSAKFPAVKKIYEFFENSIAKLVFAVVAGITGLFKIISVFYTDVPVVGDLFIALSSFVICVYFLDDTLAKNAKLTEKLSGFYTFTDKYKVAIGIVAIALSVLHFCFPNVVLI